MDRQWQNDALTDRAIWPVPVGLAGSYARLEPLGPEHARGLFEALRGEDQAALLHYTSDEPLADEAAARAMIAGKCARADALYFACMEQGSSACAGYLSLMRIELDHRCAEIGNILFTRALRGARGAADIIYLLLRHVFEDLGFRRIEWKCDVLNERSRRAALRYGFVFEGVFRQHMIVKGRNRNTAWYSMLDHEWPQRRETLETWLSPSNFDSSGRQIVALSELTGVGSS